MYSREDVVDADDAVWSGRSAVVYDSGVTLYPHPPTLLSQESVVFGGDLSFYQHCREKNTHNQSENMSDTFTSHTLLLQNKMKNKFIHLLFISISNIAFFFCGSFNRSYTGKLITAFICIFKP